jgi:hypothetical protein
MSRSRKKTKIHGFAVCDSEAQDKRIWHKRMRARERDRLITDPESEPTHEDEVSSTWSMGKDGKTYWADMPERMMRK